MYMAFPAYIGWLLVAALIISSIGFYKYVYFISLGYGFSIAGLGLLMLALFRDSLSVGTVLTCLLFFVYGCRLGGFLLIRELKSAAYRSTIKRNQRRQHHRLWGQVRYLDYLRSFVCPAGSACFLPPVQRRRDGRLVHYRRLCNALWHHL